MKTEIHEWPDYIAEIFRVTAPGGYTQFTEITMEFNSKNNALGNDAALKVVQNALQKYAAIHHLDLQVGSKLADLVRRAGFHSIEVKVVDVPCGVWPSGEYCLAISLMDRCSEEQNRRLNDGAFNRRGWDLGTVEYGCNRPSGGCC